MIKADHSRLSIQQQCEILDIPRSSYYYEPVPMDAFNFRLMNRMDALHTAFPFLGGPQLTNILRLEGNLVNIKRIKRLMGILGITAIYPKPVTSPKNKAHAVYPYLLRNPAIHRPNQVWAADITYIRLKRGYVYLVAIMDWASRYVLTWEISNTLDHYFCTSALLGALSQAQPEIFNTDQGSQFTCNDFTGILHGYGVQISMDGVGRATDNIFIERLWRSLKYEDIYLKHYETVDELYDGLNSYFDFYNNYRPHDSLGKKTPAQIYFNKEVYTSIEIS